MRRITTAAVAGVTLVLTGCGTGANTPGAAPVSTTSTGPPAHSSLAAPSSPASAGKVLTIADDGATVTVSVGQQLEVVLVPGPGAYAWDRPQLTGSSLQLVSAAGFYPLRGPMQAIFRAVLPGTAVVSSVSDLPCLHTQPRCLVAQRIWTARVVVR